MSDFSHDPASGLDFIALGETRHPKHLLVLLHGTGDSCEGFRPVGEAFAETFENALVLIPNGPVPMSALFPPEQLAAVKAANPDFDPEAARNWAGPSKIAVTADPNTLADMVDEVIVPPARALNTLIDGQLKKYGLEDKDLALFGFSAGGMIALHSAILRDEPCAGVVSQSGHFLCAEGAVSTPKVLMLFGDQEMANPKINALFSGSAEYLRQLGLDVDEYVCKDLGHGFSEESMDMACAFIAVSLGIIEPEPGPEPAAKEPSKPSGRKPPQP